jgi:lactate dehydrogenase-like 2-hydroxyacid dehydrogenase
MKIAILDDYQNVALRLALGGFGQKSRDQRLQRLRQRERTPLSHEIIKQLPELKLIASTGPRNAAIDETVARERGITVTGRRYWPTAA